MKLFTVGYEKQEIEAFCKKLKKQKINLLIDVRKNPVSRKRGFSKKKLAENLKNDGIQYLHLPGVGVPTYWRKMAKIKMISREKMFRDYDLRILPKCTDEIKIIREFIKNKRVVLMCYEKDSGDCHRSFLAKKITKKSNIENLNF